MDSGFPNPMGDRSRKKIKSPFNFDAPPYDERSSCFVNTGTHHGVGHKNPVGHTSQPKQNVPSLPFGRHHKTMQVDGKSTVNEKLNIEE